ncbi:MAG: methyltransferase domain-containing protein [Nitrospirales bacterium]|nr:class I SAM-dependent methyltransferase [Nitrospira sp.]MDR4499944.1 methyltransferase domain-containing protein [Nitrospirales bacterium]
MTSQQSMTGASPQRILEAINAHQRSAILKAGIDLGVFTAIDEGYESVPALAERCATSERGMRMLADGLAILGFLTKDENHYGLMPDSKAFLVSSSPTYLGGTVDFMLSAPLYDGFRHLTEAVRKGGTALDEKGTTAEEHPEWVTFAQAMVPMMMPPAKWIAHHLSEQAQQGEPVKKVLDIAAGHGMFGIEIGKAFPEAVIVGLDSAPVLEVAKKNAQAASLGDRYQTIAGNAFTIDFKSDYDLILLPNFLHHFDAETCVSLLRKVHASLHPNGRVITVEFVPHEDRVSPSSADFALIMLVTTPGGDAYTFMELDRMFRAGGFPRSEMFAVPESKEHVLISYKN